MSDKLVEALSRLKTITPLRDEALAERERLGAAYRLAARRLDEIEAKRNRIQHDIVEALREIES
jgi:hypothetical protein